MEDNINEKYLAKLKKRSNFDSEQIINGIENQDRASISTAITFIENKNFQFAPEKFNFLSALTPKKNTLRIAITGTPGSGKSTLIEQLGLLLIEKGYSVAVLTIDPSSEQNKGSILGDKTRMEKLAKSPQAYIRPSSNNLETGGIRSSTYQAIRICEAAKFDFILIETVGVGQSEIDASRVADLVMLLITPTGGDELQGIKKGIVETADMILINKADGAQVEQAKLTKSEYKRAVHLQRPSHKLLGRLEVKTISALKGEGLIEIADQLVDLRNNVPHRKTIDQKRKQQDQRWFQQQAEDLLLHRIKNHKVFNAMIERYANENSYFHGLSRINDEIISKLKNI